MITSIFLQFLSKDLKTPLLDIIIKDFFFYSAITVRCMIIVYTVLLAQRMIFALHNYVIRVELVYDQ